MTPPEGSLVDWVGWAGAPAEVAAYAGADRIVYAVEASLIEDREPPHHEVFRWLGLREAVFYRHDEPDPLGTLSLRVFPNSEVQRQGAMVDAVWVDGVPAPHDLQGDDLQIRLPAALRRGQSTRVVVQLAVRIGDFERRLYSGPQLPEAVAWLGHSDGSVNLGDFVAVVRPSFDRADVPPGALYRTPISPAARFHVTLTVPSSYEVAATGAETGRHLARQAWTVVHEARARTFAAALVPTGQTSEVVEVDGVRLRVVAPDGAAGAPWLERAASEVLATYTRRFGPLADPEVDVVLAPLIGTPVATFPGVVLVDLRWTPDAGEEGALAEGIARLWWGEEVGSDRVRQPWVDEALVGFSTVLYWQEAHGAEAAADRFDVLVREQIRSLLEVRRGDVPANLGVWAYVPEEYDAIVRGVGAAFYTHLQEVAGDEALFAALRAYRADWSGRIATERDLLRALRSAARKRLLDELVQRWVRSQVDPDEL